MDEIEKATEIRDAKITFVSLVDAAANLRQFLITKGKNQRATFSSCGRILKADSAKHYVTGIVYEPLAEDAHGDFMSAEEIEKAAHGYLKNSGMVDIQHSFEPFKGASVVESWIAKSDGMIGDQPVKAGTWLMTMEVTDAEVWDKIAKGEITGFSMGGMGIYSEEDVDLEQVEKTKEKEQRGLLKKLAALVGMDVVEKGEFQDRFNHDLKAREFWTAFQTLEDLLGQYCTPGYVPQPEPIRQALTEFSATVEEILTGEEPILNAVIENRPVSKAGRKISSANREALQGIYDSLGSFLAQFDGDEGEGTEAAGDTGVAKSKEEIDMTKEEVQTMVDEAVAKAMEPKAEITAEEVQKMVDTAIEKAFKDAEVPELEVHETEGIDTLVEQAVSKAIEPLLKKNGVASALNDTADTTPHEEKHFLYGIL